MLLKSANMVSVKNPPSDWCLEGFAGEDKTLLIDITPLPFVIGRHKECQLCLSSAEVSRRHAEIYRQGDQIWIREFGSTNGTYINHTRLVGEQILKDGDILHFGSVEFRVIQHHKRITARALEDSTLMVPALELPRGFLNCAAEFENLLRQGLVVAHFQPIVRLADSQVMGYELLGRGNAPELPRAPWPLLQIAKRMRKEVELSELFRRTGIQHAMLCGLDRLLFMNTTPSEINIGRLKRSLLEMTALGLSFPIALEVHESTMTSLPIMRELRSLLSELGIQLAYDDFGAGQARLVELIAVPPDYLKFDLSLIHDIHQHPPRARHALKTLVSMACDLGIATVAEGVEVAGELDVCRSVGFDLVQGYYLGKPEPLTTKRGCSDAAVGDCTREQGK